MPSILLTAKKLDLYVIKHIMASKRIYCPTTVISCFSYFILKQKQTVTAKFYFIPDDKVKNNKNVYSMVIEDISGHSFTLQAYFSLACLQNNVS